MKCNTCGAEVLENQVFCQECGARVEGSENIQYQPYSPQPFQQPPNPYYNQQQNFQYPNQNENEFNPNTVNIVKNAFSSTQFLMFGIFTVLAFLANVFSLVFGAFPVPEMQSYAVGMVIPSLSQFLIIIGVFLLYANSKNEMSKNTAGSTLIQAYYILQIVAMGIIMFALLVITFVVEIAFSSSSDIAYILNSLSHETGYNLTALLPYTGVFIFVFIFMTLLMIIPLLYFIFLSSFFGSLSKTVKLGARPKKVSGFIFFMLVLMTISTAFGSLSAFTIAISVGTIMAFFSSILTTLANIMLIITFSKHNKNLSMIGIR